MNDLSNCTVLLVDDVKDNINILVEALRGDYKLGFALDGPSAIKYTRGKLPDLILLDIMMPGMDGYEVCKILKNNPLTRHIPIIFCTAIDELERKTAGFEAGAVDYITKPFEILEVKARVKTHLTLKMALERLERRRRQMQHSLDLAMEVQQSLLPSKAPVIDGLDIAGTSIYCDETGGDYFDYLDRGSNQRIGVVVGDVSDHGVQSALLMTTARAFLRHSCSTYNDIRQIVTDVNKSLTRDAEETGHFMTLFFCDIDRSDLKATWISAGHDSAVLYDRSKDAFEELGGQGLALGIVSSYDYVEKSRDLKHGQIIVIGTDGIWETHSPEGEQFGKKRFMEIIRRESKKSAQDILQAVVDEVSDFRAPLQKEDDVTLVVIKIEETG